MEKNCRNCGNVKTEACNTCVSSMDYPTPSGWILSPEAFDKENKPEKVNHPPHYKTGKFECIEVMPEVFGVEYTKAFCLGNAFKYIWRCKLKHEKTTDDIKKAIFYLNEYLKLDGEQNE